MKKKTVIKGKPKGKAPIKGTRKNYLTQTMSKSVEGKIAVHKGNLKKIAKIKPKKD